MNDELKGTPVLVNPELNNDPIGMQGKVGFISRADLMNDDIFVSFADKIGLYSSDALLVLLPVEEIHRNLAEMAYETPFRELKALTQIDLFLRYGGEAKTMNALEIAVQNRSIQYYCLDSLQNQLSAGILKTYGRE